MASILQKVRLAYRMIDWPYLMAKPGNCPICGATIFVRLNRTDWGVRCVRCGAAPNTLILAEALRYFVDDLHDKQIYVLSAAGPLFEFLRRNCRMLTYSVFNETVAPGEYANGVLSQDVQRLTFPDESFDLCIHSEVFEHVPDDLAGFRELRRVLKPGGMTLFTIPVFDRETTLERARIIDGRIQHIETPEYHDDQLRGSVLAFRDYGRDVLERVRSAGFRDVRLFSSPGPARLKYVRPGFDRPVVIALR